MNKTAKDIKLYTIIETLVDLKDDFSDTIIPSGTQGSIIESFSHPKVGYAVDLAIPDPNLVGSFRYFNLILSPEQIRVFHQDQTLS